MLRGDGLVPKSERLSDSEKTLLEAYVKMSQIPKECLKALLPEAQPDKFGSAEVCEKLERGAKGNLRSLFCMALACQPSTTWPRLAHWRHIFGAVAVEQYRGKGCRLHCN